MSLETTDDRATTEDAASAEPTFEELAGAVDNAIRRAGELDAGDREVADELRRAVEAFHRPVLVSIVRALRDDPRGRELLFELVDDPHLRAVLSLHGLIRPDPLTRARQAVDRVRPYLQSHGGDVDVVAVRDGVASVRLRGACSGCSMSAVTLREGVEEALVAGVEEIERIEVLDDEPTETIIPVEAIGRRSAETGWIEGPAVDTVEPGSLVRVDVRHDGRARSFVVTNVGRRISVFVNACVHQGLQLDGGSLDDGVLTCPWHGFRFDATSGECITAPGAQLEQVPTRVDDGRVWIRPS